MRLRKMDNGNYEIVFGIDIESDGSLRIEDDQIIAELPEGKWRWTGRQFVKLEEEDP